MVEYDKSIHGLFTAFMEMTYGKLYVVPSLLKLCFHASFLASASGHSATVTRHRELEQIIATK